MVYNNYSLTTNYNFSNYLIMTSDCDWLSSLLLFLADEEEDNEKEYEERCERG